MKFEYRQLGSSRDAEADRIVGDLEKELKDQQRATLEWKVGIPKINVTVMNRTGLLTRNRKKHESLATLVRTYDLDRLARIVKFKSKNSRITKCNTNE